ncbi:MAG: SUMF1/EgtB/PvdO family nonheme iron enzyme [Verrucomicrobiota bacterium]
MLTLMAITHAEVQLPDNRIDLYEKLSDTLLWTWDEERKGIDCNLSALLSDKKRDKLDFKVALGELAFEVTKTGGSDFDAPGNISRSALRDQLKKHLCNNDDVWLDDVLNTISGRSSLLRHVDDEVFVFPHRSFQEYLAARYYLNRLEDYPKAAAKLAAEDLGFWRKVLLLSVPALGETDGVGKPVELALELCPSQAPRAEAQQLLESFAGEVLLEIGLHRVAQSALAKESKILSRVRRRLANHLKRARFDVHVRAAAGFVLGNLGDPRPGVGLSEEGLPDIDFLTIEPGKLLYGDEKVTTTIEHGFEIARYPVTVAQFGVFVNDQDGYRNPNWWNYGKTAEDFDGGPEDYDAVSQTPNHPRVGVSWFEAMAFCTWLSVRRGERIELPDEKEWERAARHTDGRRYPWSADAEKVTANHCNCSITGIAHTSAVGAFPHGAAESRAVDTSGNVWEWCKNWSPPGEHSKSVRGGSFCSDAVSVRCANRYLHYPSFRLNDVGFRLVRRPQ